jgi:hypothetical protein
MRLTGGLEVNTGSFLLPITLCRMHNTLRKLTNTYLGLKEGATWKKVHMF